jgi:hypothetical protein
VNPQTAAVATPVESLIRVIRGQKVLLDTDLAALYEVPTFRLNEAVKRNRDRFPDDFMFQLTAEEVRVLTSHFAMSNNPKVGRGGRRTLPYAFTEHGVAMLSSVLNSERAIQMNIYVIRAFIRIRELANQNAELAARVERLELGQERTVSVIEVLVTDIDSMASEIRQMQAPPIGERRRIGFVQA